MQVTVKNPDGTTATLQVPDTATVLPFFAQTPGYQAFYVNYQVQFQAGLDNRSAMKWKADCAQYLADAERDRELGVPLPVKPTAQPVSHVVRTVTDVTGALYLWVEPGPLLGDPCPDLPPAQPMNPPAGVVDIGIRISNTAYWNEGPNDNPPQDVRDGKPVSATTHDGVSGTFVFVASPMSNAGVTKGWWLKLAGLILALAWFAAAPARVYAQTPLPSPAIAGITVTLQANPEPMVISANLPQKAIGKWDISACVDSSVPGVVLPVERIRMAFPSVPLMTAANAVLVLQYKASKNWKQVVATILGEASLALVPIGASGVFPLSSKAAGYLASAHGLADYAQSRLAHDAPNIAPLTADLIAQSLQVPSGGCVTGGMFAGLVHQPKPVMATLTLR